MGETDYVTLTRNEALVAIRVAVNIQDQATREEAVMHLVAVVQVVERLRGTIDVRST